MKLYLDAGNSSAKWKLWCGDALFDKGRFVYGDDLVGLQALFKHEVEEVWLAEVGAGKLHDKISTLFAGELHIVRSEAHCLGVTNSYAEPERLGVDRLLALVEAYHLSNKKACCVIDIGTAATIDVVNANGVHQGGHIVPGLTLLRESLLKNTDKVRYEVKQSLDLGLGRSTRAAVENGTWSMLLAWVKQELALFCQDFAGAEVFITGGLALDLVDSLPEYPLVVAEDLVIDALRRLSLS